MKTIIRLQTFETNSSSSHSLILRDTQLDKLDNQKLAEELLDPNGFINFHNDPAYWYFGRRPFKGKGS